MTTVAPFYFFPLPSLLRETGNPTLFLSLPCFLPSLCVHQSPRQLLQCHGTVTDTRHVRGELNSGELIRVTPRQGSKKPGEFLGKQGRETEAELDPLAERCTAGQKAPPAGDIRPRLQAQGSSKTRSAMPGPAEIMNNPSLS